MRMLFWPCVSALLGPRDAVTFSFLQERASVQEEPAAQQHGDSGEAPALGPSAAPQLAEGQEEHRPDAVTADSRIDGLLELSDKVLQGTTELLADALPAKTGSSSKESVALAAHAGQLERLFKVLGSELQEESEQAMKLEDPAVRAGGGLSDDGRPAPGGLSDDGLRISSEGETERPMLHREPVAASFEEAGIGDPPDPPASRGFLARDRGAHRSQQRPLALPELAVLAVAVLAALALCALVLAPDAARSAEAADKPESRSAKPWRSCGPGLRLKAPGDDAIRASQPGAQAAAETTDQGKTSYVVRIVKVRVEDVASAAPLAWQVRYKDEQRKPSRFIKTGVWDAPVDGLDVDLDDPAGSVSFALLANTQMLEPPEAIGSADVSAAALLADARAAAGRTQGQSLVHERHVALHAEGKQVGVLVFEYSLIAFFHWYVGASH